MTNDLDLDDLAQQQLWEAKQEKYRTWYRQVFGHEPEEEETTNEHTGKDS